MHRSVSIKNVRNIFQGQRINLPEAPGVYAFWWTGDKKELLQANRHIVLKGPGERPVDVEFMDWWPAELEYPCLYVGKSTNIKNRFSLHIKRKCEGRLHEIPETNEKQKAVTTTCQLRYGIEHVFKYHKNPLGIIFNKVGFSYTTDFPKNAIAERFYAEDHLIGTWKPWFNVDSER
jgi:hypothetical protein